MTKADLIKHVAGTCGLPLSMVANVIDVTTKAVKDELAVGGSIHFVGFGKFGVHNYAARKGVNPRTGKPIDIPAKKVPHFQAGRALREAVNQ